MRKSLRKYLVVIAWLMLAGRAFAQATPTPTVQWQSVQSLITAIQTQLNTLASAINNAVPIVPATQNGQFIVSQASANPVWATMSGDLTCSTVTAGQCDVSSLDSLTIPIGLTGSRSDGSDFAKNLNINGVYNVRTWGAVGDCTTDDWASIESAYVAACNASSTSGAAPKVYLPATPNSCYKISLPLYFNCGNPFTVAGDGSADTVITAAGQFPVMIVVPPGWYSASNTYLTSPLFGAVGKSFNWSGSTPAWTPWISPMLASDAALGAIPFNGLSAFTVEEAFTTTDTSNGDNSYIFAAAGSEKSRFVNTSDTATGGLADIFYTIGTGGTASTIEARNSLSGGLADSGAVGSFSTLSAAYIADSYDGAHSQLYANGTRVANTAQTGTVNNAPGNEVYAGTIGNVMGLSPAGFANAGHVPLGTQIFALRISNTARYTGATMSVPTSLPACDANTLIQINGTQAFPTETLKGSLGTITLPIISPECVNGATVTNAWQPIIFPDANPGVSHLRVQGLNLKGGTVGLFVGLVQDSIFDDIWTSGQSYLGFAMMNNSYGNTFITPQSDLPGGSPDQFANMVISSGINTIFHPKVALPGYWDYIDGAGGNKWIEPWITTSSACVAASGNGGIFGSGMSVITISKYTATSIDHPLDDSENNATCPQLTATGAGQVVVTGGNWQESNQNDPIFQIGNDAGLTVKLDGTAVEDVGSSAGEIINCLGGTGPLNITWDAPQINGGTLAANTIPVYNSNCNGKVNLIGDQVRLPAVGFNTIYSAAGTAIPAAATANAHMAACVSDSTACVGGTTYVSGGSTNWHLHTDGSAWKEDGFGC